MSEIPGTARRRLVIGAVAVALVLGALSACRCGSGGFLDFDVLGLTGPDEFGVLHSETGLADGQVTQDGDRLVVVSGSEERSVTYSDGQLR
ncbi:hypothetical protein O7632_26940 [Solwaraspora sp. WMMD406]|uniref:hypothetical protein n=1 Tax=Solwaraspora sp. WMMD406 TaxID=3016095 RepID=UPI002417DCC3|nr:hypothetical protein [Solwaraspora sp. WMMD406]MDG4767702.1 hypothetical protein [Solwaraspora sp. WMMD406]